MGIRVSHLPQRSAPLQEVGLAGNCIIIAEHNIISLEREGFIFIFWKQERRERVSAGVNFKIPR